MEAVATSWDYRLDAGERAKFQGDEIFNQYLSVCELLETKSTDQIEKSLREFELILLREIGYGINLDSDYSTEEPIMKEKNYAFFPLSGFKETKSIKGIRGEDIVNFSRGNFEEISTRRSAKKIMREAIDSGRVDEKELLYMIALERIGDPIEVSNVISFLLSDDSSYITGTTIDIDGGFSIRKIN